MRLGLGGYGLSYMTELWHFYVLGLVPVVASLVTDASSWRVGLRVLAVGGWLFIVPSARWGEPSGHGEDAAEEAVETDGATLVEARRTASFWLLAAVLFLFYAY